MENTRAAPCILHNADTAATKHKNRRDRPGGFLSLLSPPQEGQEEGRRPGEADRVQRFQRKTGAPEHAPGRPPTFFDLLSVGLQDVAQIHFGRAPHETGFPVPRGPRGKLHFLGGSESRLRQDLGPRPRCLCAADAAPVLWTGGRGPQLGFSTPLRSTSAASFHRRSSS